MTYHKRTLLPIGIHLNPDAVHMVQLAQTESGMEMVSIASRYFEPVSSAEAKGSGEYLPQSTAAGVSKEADYAQARNFIRQQISTDGFGGKEVVISLPTTSLMIHHVRLPPLPPEELAGALPSELQSKLPFDPKDAVIRHLVAGTTSENNEPKQDVIVLAAHRTAVEKHAMMMTRLGLHVVGVGIEPCAMCYPYMFASAAAPPAQVGPPGLMIVNLGTQSTHVAIIRGSETTFVKGVDLGTGTLVGALAKARNLSSEQAAALRAEWRDSSSPENLQEAVAAYNGVRWCIEQFVEEIASCMRYHASLSRGARIDRLYFVGREANDLALVHVLSAHLDVPCEVGDPCGAVAGKAVQEKNAGPETAVAVGLGLFNAE